ncbi:hypothetical protein Tco_0530452 [Tanacetum coccineum]
MILTTNMPYPSRKIRRIRAYTHQRPQRKQDLYTVSREDQYVVLEIRNEKILEDIKRGPYSKKPPIRRAWQGAYNLGVATPRALVYAGLMTSGDANYNEMPILMLETGASVRIANLIPKSDEKVVVISARKSLEQRHSPAQDALVRVLGRMAEMRRVTGSSIYIFPREHVAKYDKIDWLLSSLRLPWNNLLEAI